MDALLLSLLGVSVIGGAGNGNASEKRGGIVSLIDPSNGRYELSAGSTRDSPEMRRYYYR